MRGAWESLFISGRQSRKCEPSAPEFRHSCIASTEARKLLNRIDVL